MSAHATSRPAPPDLPLAGKTLSHGYLTKNSGEFKRFVTSHGGQVSYLINKQTTLFVCREDEVIRRSSKVQTAQRVGVPIVSEQYVYDLVAAASATGTALDIAPYTLYDPSADERHHNSSSSNNNINNGGGGGLRRSGGGVRRGAAGAAAATGDESLAHAGQQQPQQPQQQQEAAGRQQVRLFVSSTFRDMHEERRLLATAVLPRIAQLCAERNVTFSYVDLRWGVTSEAAGGARTLSLCLQEIDACRPYFICMLGERYGWHQPPPGQYVGNAGGGTKAKQKKEQQGEDVLLRKTFEQAMPRHPWLGGYTDRSVTEIEVLHGALNESQPHQSGGHNNSRCLFYFRDPGYVPSSGTANAADYACESPTARARLQALKTRVRKSRLPLHDNYKTPEEFARLALADLTRYIELDCPRPEELDPWLLESGAHRRYARQLAGPCYVRREGLLQDLSDFVRDESITTPLVVFGPAGSGKSTNVAKWFDEYLERSRYSFSSGEHHLELLHVVGATADSATPVETLRRWMHALRRAFALSLEVPNGDDSSRSDAEQQQQQVPLLFPAWAGAAALRGKVVIVLDGLDKMVCDDFGWLPERLPAGFKLIVTCSSTSSASVEGASKAEQIVRKRGWPSLQVPPLTSADVAEYSDGYLSLFGKSLSGDQLETLQRSPHCSNALFLRLTLDQLRLLSSFESLSSDLARYVATGADGDGDGGGGGEGGLRRLYGRVLANLEATFPVFNARSQQQQQQQQQRQPQRSAQAPQQGGQQSQPSAATPQPQQQQQYRQRHQQQQQPDAWGSLTARAVSLLLASRAGLTETELHDTAVSWQPLVKQPHASSAAAAGDDAQQRRQEQWPALWQALRDMLLANTGGIYQLANEPLRQAVRDAYGGLQAAAHQTLVSYLLQQHQHQPAAAYLLAAGRRLLLELPHQLAAVGDTAALKAFLSAADNFRQLYPKAKQELFRYWRLVAPAPSSSSWTAACVGALSASLPLPVSSPEAAGYGQLLAQCFEEIGEYKAAADMVGHVLLYYRSDSGSPAATAAAAATTAADQATAAIGGYRPTAEVAAALRRLASLQTAQSLYEAAEATALLAVRLCEHLPAGGASQEAAAETYAQLGLLAKKQAKYDKAKKLYEKSLAIVERKFGKDNPKLAGYLNLLADIYRKLELYEPASALYRRAFSLLEKSYGDRHPDSVEILVNLALIEKKKANYAASDELCRQCLQLVTDSYGPAHPKVAAVLNNLADVFRKRGDLGEAQRLYRQALDLVETTLGADHAEAADILNNMGLIEKKACRYGEARELFKRAADILRARFALGHPKLGFVTNNLGDVCRKRGDFDGARALYEQALLILEKSLGPDHPEVAEVLNNLGLVHKKQADYEQAERLYLRCVDIVSNAFGTFHPKLGFVLNNVADVYRKLSKYGDAEETYKRALAIIEPALGSSHIEVAEVVGNLGLLYFSMERYSLALSFFERALKSVTAEHSERHYKAGVLLKQMADARRKLLDVDEALSLYQRSLDILSETLGEDHEEFADACNGIGLLLALQGQFDEAAARFETALDIARRSFGDEKHPKVAAYRDNMLKALAGTPFV